VIAQIIAGTGMMLMFAGRYAYNKAYPKQAGDLSDIYNMLKDWKKSDGETLTGLTQGQNILVASALDEEVQQFSKQVLDLNARYREIRDGCGTNASCLSGAQDAYQQEMTEAWEAKGEGWWDKIDAYSRAGGDIPDGVADRPFDW
jgi:hypothetical protein